MFEIYTVNNFRKDETKLRFLLIEPKNGTNDNLKAKFLRISLPPMLRFRGQDRPSFTRGKAEHCNTQRERAGPGS
jgi:hypothetical protein